MPTLPEDREFDEENAEENAEVSRRYRETAREEPSVRVEAAILEAARREAGRPLVARNWRVPASVAAVLVIGVSLSLLTREGVDPLPPLDQSRRQAAEVARPAAPSLAMKGEPAPKARLDLQSRPSRDRSDRDDGKAEVRPGDGPANQSAGTGQVTEPEVAASASPQVRQSDGPAATAEAPSVQQSASKKPSASAPGLERSAGDRALAQSSVRPGAIEEKQALADAEEEERARAKSLRKEESAAAVQLDAGQPPERWLRSIEDLIRSRKQADARAQLAEFRKRYPDYRLPDTLQAFEREAAPDPPK